jgi:hypothetical protein
MSKRQEEIQEALRLEAEKKLAIELVEKLANYVNIMGRDYAPFIERLIYGTHRTLQQSVFGLFLQCIKGFAELPERYTDPRNEATVEVCKKIMEAVEGRTRLPLI